MPIMIAVYLCTTPPPYEGFFQLNPQYKPKTLSPADIKRYLMFSSLTVDPFTLSPINKQKTLAPINNRPFLVDLFIKFSLLFTPLLVFLFTNSMNKGMLK